MKRWIWLLALPYVVTVSTWDEFGINGPVTMTVRRVGTMYCSGTQEECLDIADSLNQAHEHRTKENKSRCPTCVITTEPK